MNDPNRVLKWITIVVLIALAALVLYPPQRKLKGGIDLVGGTSLLYEIDITGLDSSQQHNLSTKVMGILKDRVDPKSQLNLEWRPVGNTRLEIRMPRPPREALARRDAKEKALDSLEKLNLTRFTVEQALNTPEPERQLKLTALKRGIPERDPLIEAMVAAFDAQRSAKEKGEEQASMAFSAAYEKSIGDLLATSLSRSRVADILALERKDKRDEEIARLRASFPAYDSAENGKLLTQAIAAYDEWTVDKADLEDPSDLKRRLKGAGVLEFRILAERDPSSPDTTMDPNNPEMRQPIAKYTEQLQRQGPRGKSLDRFRWFPVSDVLDFLNLKDISELENRKNQPGQPIVEEYAGRHYVLVHNDREYGLLRSSGKTKWSLKQAYPDRDFQTGEIVVSFVLDARGGQFFHQLTSANVGRFLCIMLDDSAMSAARIREAIGERCQISGDFSQEDAQNLVRTLDAGSLPARLKETPLAEKTIGPSLGQTNRERGMKAAMFGAISVVAFILIYYGVAGGGVANLALMLNLLFTLAIMSVLEATFTLPGIAGLILTVGMAIDANVLIFERIREERARGVPFKKALNLGYEKAFSAILDGNLTTLLTSIILIFVGSEEIKGFAITLGLGLATSMFTALTVTRLIFNTLIDAGMLKDLSMRRLIGIPNVNWVEMRRIFWPISLTVTVLGSALFVGVSLTNKEALYDIEFLGGTSVQIDLKPEHKLTDEDVSRAIASTGIDGKPSAADWLTRAADLLGSASASSGEASGQYVLSSDQLNGAHLGVLMRRALESSLERDGITAAGHRAMFDTKPGQMTLEAFRQKIQVAAEGARSAAAKLRKARVQTVEDLSSGAKSGLSYEIVTTETNRDLVQAALLATFEERLSVQRSIRFTTAIDQDLTRESHFVIEGEDQYLSDVLPVDADYDIRPYRGGVVVHVTLEADEEALPKEELERRLREVALQPEFEQFRTGASNVFPLGSGKKLSDGRTGYNQFAVCAVDEAVHYDENPALWTEVVAHPQAAQVAAALGSERSLSKVIQFAPQVAGQMQVKAVYALALSFLAISAYVWLRFGTKDYGLAVLVALAHDVAVTLGAVALCNYIFDNPIGRLLLLEDFRVDLSFVAAILTIIGYSLNDTIVVFDRIRENRGRVGTLSANMINTSINQTVSRTVLTSLTVFLVVILLYVFGGPGVHLFSFALVVGTLSGVYSTVAIAVPLVYRPKVLRTVVWSIAAVGLVGIIFVLFNTMWPRVILSVLAVAGCAVALKKSIRPGGYSYQRQPAMA